MTRPHQTRRVTIGSIATLAMLLIVGVAVGQGPSTVNGKEHVTPVSRELELAGGTCTPLVLVAPADSSVVLHVRNTSSVDRVVVVAPATDPVSIEPGASQVIEFQLDAGQYRLLCGPPDAPEAETVELDVVDSAMLEDPPVTSLATPLGSSTPRSG
jgi:hypothetical protein